MDIVRNDRAAQVLTKAMDGLSLRSQTAAHNIANVDTPNFRSSAVTFEEDLRAAISRPAALAAGESTARQLTATDPRHLSLGGAPGGPAPGEGASGLERRGGLDGPDAITPKVASSGSTTMRRDGNNVDIDHEMTQLAETQLSFGAATQLLNIKFQQLRHAIWEGRK